MIIFVNLSRRCEKVRRMFQTVMDPANLSSTITNEAAGPSQVPTTSTGTNPDVVDSSAPPSLIYPSPEQIKQLTTVISNVLQPCNLINKILGDVIGTIIPPAPVQQQQQQPQQATPMSSSAPPTQDPPATPANSEGSATPSGLGLTVAQNDDLIKKITESCNQILSSQNLMQDALKNLQSQDSLAEKNEEVIKKISESANSLFDSQNTVKNILASMNSSSASGETLIEMPIPSAPVEPNSSISLNEDSILVVTPPLGSLRSRESSIEVQENASMMSDDGDREWTIIEDENDTGSPKKYTGAIPKRSISLMESSEDEIDEIPVPGAAPVEPKMVAVTLTSTNPVTSLANLNAQRSMSSTASQAQSSTSIQVQTEPAITPQKQSETQTEIPQAPQTAQTQTIGAVGPAVIVYHEEPKINRAVHAMVDMGYSNEDNWLTQLCLNVNGDVAKALAFLTPNK